MMNDLRDLYQEVIIDHNRSPRNFKQLEPCSHQAEGFNPLCGDKINVYLNIEEGKVADISFDGNGCAISIASASLMTEMLKGLTIEETNKLFKTFHHIVTEDGEVDSKQIGKLTVLSGVKEYPARVKCATLAWHTLQAALENATEITTTE